jgi:N-succinyldiaminopimelate aminotransferase
VAEFARYPVNEGTPGLLSAIAEWTTRRHGVTIDPTRQLMVLNGTREGLFNAVRWRCVPRRRAASVRRC